MFLGYESRLLAAQSTRAKSYQKGISWLIAICKIRRPACTHVQTDQNLSLVAYIKMSLGNREMKTEDLTFKAVAYIP